jgi:hypothetical protein
MVLITRQSMQHFFVDFDPLKNLNMVTCGERHEAHYIQNLIKSLSLLGSLNS